MIDHEHKPKMRMQKILLVCNLLMVVCCVSIMAQDNRSINGFNNNTDNPELGSAGDLFTRVTSVSYTDGVSSIDETRPNARYISNELFVQDDNIVDNEQLSDFTWAFAQFIAHEIFQYEGDTEQKLEIAIPEGDAFFDPSQPLLLPRAKATDESGAGTNLPNQYQNQVTAFIDGSNIYGSDEQTANWLRSYVGGKLKMSSNGLLPWNTISGDFNDEIDPNAPIMKDETGALVKYFVAGDTRANQNPLLIAFHTIFVREHNRLCDELAEQHPNWNDERLYQRARKINGGLLQFIVYNEFLPTIGINLPAYTGYKSTTDARIMNIFAGAAFQIANTLINSNLIRMDYDGSELSQGNISIGDAFFNPLVVSYVDGIDPYIKGMATQIQQDLDCKMIDEVRNFEYKQSETIKGTDKAAVSITRGRDLGLPTYNDVRTDLGLPRYNSFENLTNNIEARNILHALYDDINNCDAWVGMLAENHLPNSIFGQVTSLVIERQFQALRDGDRYFYMNDPLLDLYRNEIESTTLSDVVMRNTGIDLMQRNVFSAMAHENIPDGPDLIPILLDAAIYPNPVSEEVQVKVYLDLNQTLTATIIDYMGRQVLQETFSGVPGDNFFTIPLNVSCQRGFYNLILESGDEFKVLKFVKE